MTQKIERMPFRALPARLSWFREALALQASRRKPDGKNQKPESRPANARHGDDDGEAHLLASHNAQDELDCEQQTNSRTY